MPFEAPQNFNIADYFLDARIREGRGERIALRLDGTTMTYVEVQQLANQFGRVLQRLGVRPEERVLISLPDGAEFVGALFGILKIGAVVVMVNPHLSPAKLAEMLDYSKARLAVVAESSIAPFEEAFESSTHRPTLLTVGFETVHNPSFEASRRSGDDDLETLGTHPDDPAIWLFSGGTTGKPKAVVQPHASFANTTECYAKSGVGYREDDITLSIPKLYFGYATGSNLLFPFAMGASTVLFPEHPTAEIVFAKIEEHRPSILVNVPTMVHQMLAHPAAAQSDLSSLRFATSAGEALPVPLYHRWHETFGVELLDGLGTAEMWHIFVSNTPGNVRPGTLGRSVPGFDVRVRDESGADLPAGEVGRLWVRGGSRALGYWQNLARSKEAFRGEWYVAGDLIRMDEEGFVTYCGRDDDVLKVGGKWLAPQEVESCLMRHPSVEECAVVGVEVKSGLTKPVAYVVCSPARRGLEDELKQFVLDRLQPYKHPRQVVILERFPRTHLGKIDRGKLKTMSGIAAE